MLTGQTYTSDPEEYLARLHTCITEQERRANLIRNLHIAGPSNPSTNAHYVDESYEDASTIDFEGALEQDIDYAVYYNHRQQPVFRQCILRNTRSLPPTTRLNRPTPGVRRAVSNSPRIQRQTPPKIPRLPQMFNKDLNPESREGEIMLCHICNSWFYLPNNCPDRHNIRTRRPYL